MNFGQRYGCVITEPHIMLLPHEILDNAKSIDRNLQSFCLSQPSFKTAVGGPNLQEKENSRMLYLTVMMGSINSIRDKLIKHMKLPRSGGMFRPLVVLAEQEPGGPYDFDSMLAEAKTLFSKSSQIDVDALGMYTRTDKNTPFAMSALYAFTGR